MASDEKLRGLLVELQQSRGLPEQGSNGTTANELLLVLLTGERTTRKEQGGRKLEARGRGAEDEAGKQRPGGTPANLAAGTSG